MFTLSRRQSLSTFVLMLDVVIEHACAIQPSARHRSKCFDWLMGGISLHISRISLVGWHEGQMKQHMLYKGCLSFHKVV